MTTRIFSNYHQCKNTEMNTMNTQRPRCQPYELKEDKNHMNLWQTVELFQHLEKPQHGLCVTEKGERKCRY